MSDDLLNQLLLARGLDTPEKREKFLQPNYLRDIYDPFLLTGISRACERILQAVKNNEKIIIFADYDADGVPGAVVLAEFFKKIKFTNFEVYIPNRHTEDYGLMEKSVREFVNNKAKLLITVDCGITNTEQVKLAGELNLDVIVTDHHLPPAELPAAYAIINPKQIGDEYPDKMLCGAGVAFKLVQGLVRTWNKKPSKTEAETESDKDEKLDLNWEKTLLDLVAIATICDRVPLVDENRALARFGLIMLRRTRRPGLLGLFRSAKLKSAMVNEDDIGFMIGPRINAASRMSHASEAYFLLTTDNLAEAQTMAEHLEKQNSERKKSVEQILQTAEARLSSVDGNDNWPAVIVMGDESWPAGLLGLGASKLVQNKYDRPIFLWGNGAGEIKGSVRSDGSVNVVELMRVAGGEDFFSNFGGHAMAGGFSLAPEKLGELEQRLLVAHDKVEKLEKEPELKPDATLLIDDVNERAWQMMEMLAPFGTGNPKPLFHFPNLEISKAKTFGNGGIHLELSFKKENGEMVCAVGFFTSSDKFKGVSLEAGEKINLTATLEKSFFKNQPELRLRIVDIKPA